MWRSPDKETHELGRPGLRNERVARVPLRGAPEMGMGGCENQDAPHCDWGFRVCSQAAEVSARVASCWSATRSGFPDPRRGKGEQNLIRLGTLRSESPLARTASRAMSGVSAASEVSATNSSPFVACGRLTTATMPAAEEEIASSTAARETISPAIFAKRLARPSTVTKPWLSTDTRSPVSYHSPVSARMPGFSGR